MITEVIKDNSQNTIYETIDFSTNNFIEHTIEVLVKHQIQSIIIEGGKQTLQSFIDKGIWDEARVFTGDKYFEKGITSPKIKGKTTSIHNINGDSLIIMNEA